MKTSAAFVAFRRVIQISAQTVFAGCRRTNSKMEKLWSVSIVDAVDVLAELYMAAICNLFVKCALKY